MQVRINRPAWPAVSNMYTKPSTKIMHWTQTTRLLQLNQKWVEFKLLINPDALTPAFPSP